MIRENFVIYIGPWELDSDITRDSLPEWIELGEDITSWGNITIVPIKKNGKYLPVKIGNRCIIQEGAVLYGGVTLRDDVRICHHAVIRENTFIGTHSIIGNLVMIEGNVTIGDHVIINSQCHLTANMKIHSYAFFGPNVTTMNDKNIKWYREGHGEDLIGPTVLSFARIGAGACLLPEIRIGENAIIGAGAVITKNVPPFEVWIGIPAQKVKRLDSLDVITESRLCKEHYFLIDDEYWKRLGLTEIKGKPLGDQYEYKSIG